MSAQDDLPAWRVATSAAGIRSLIATRDIRSGEVALTETAAVTWSKGPTSADDAIAFLAALGGAPSAARDAVTSMRCPFDASRPAAAGSPEARQRAAALFVGSFKTETAAETAEVERLLLIKLANAHELPTGEAAVFLGGSAANHACAPNLSALVERAAGRDALLTYVALLPVADGDELTVSYVARSDAWTRSAAARRAKLAASYAFRCECALCSAPDLCRAVSARCGGCSHAFAAPVTDGRGSLWACLGCGQARGNVLGAEAAERSVAGALDAARASLDDALRRGDGEAVRRVDPRSCRDLLARVESDLGPTHHCLDDTLVLLARVNTAHAHMQSAALAKVPPEDRADVEARMPPAFAPYGTSAALREEAAAASSRAARLALGRRDAHAARRPHRGSGLRA